MGISETGRLTHLARKLPRLLLLGIAVLATSRATAAVVILLPLDAAVENFDREADNTAGGLSATLGTPMPDEFATFSQNDDDLSATTAMATPLEETETITVRNEPDPDTTPEQPTRQSLVVIEASGIRFPDSPLKTFPAASFTMTLLRTVVRRQNGDRSRGPSPVELPEMKSTASSPATIPLTKVQPPTENEERLTAMQTILSRQAAIGTSDSSKLVSVLTQKEPKGEPSALERTGTSNDSSAEQVSRNQTALGPAAEETCWVAIEEKLLATPAYSAETQDRLATDSLQRKGTELDPWSFLEELKEDSAARDSALPSGSELTVQSRQSESVPPGPAQASEASSRQEDDNASRDSSAAPTLLRPAMLLTAGLLEQTSRRLERWAQLISSAGGERLASSCSDTRN